MVAEAKKISFTRDSTCDFNTVLRQRVNLYFKETRRSPKGGSSMVLKTTFYLGVIALLYGLIIAGAATSAWGVVGLYAILGFFIAIGTMNIAHDALHGAYVSSSLGNRLLGLTMDLSGASSFYWKKEHTVDHHTFTNVPEHDADLNVPILLRVCPQSERRSFHRFQHFYAPFLYSLNLIRWVYISDSKRIYRIFKNRKKDVPHKPSFSEALTLILFKLVHVSVYVLIPIMMLPLAWWQVVLAYLGGLAVTGLTMTVVFQLAHIVEDVSFPEPNEEGKIENSFTKHQLMTTSNFAINSPLAHFLFGGLNFQVEHHIFPHLCHMHLRKIAPIVKATAQEFGLPYHENASVFGAVRSHFRTLKKMGRVPQEQ